MAFRARDREPLSRERVLRAALGLVDRDGLDRLTMKRLGDALGVEAMSLYNHVPSKAAILDGIFEIILAELPPPSRRAATWQAAVRERARALRTVLQAHPNAIPVFATRPAATSASIAHADAVIATLRDAGFAPTTAAAALNVLVAYVVGHTLATYSPDREFELGLDALVTGLASRLDVRP